MARTRNRLCGHLMQPGEYQRGKPCRACRRVRDRLRARHRIQSSAYREQRNAANREYRKTERYKAHRREYQSQFPSWPRIKINLPDHYVRKELKRLYGIAAPSLEQIQAYRRQIRAVRAAKTIRLLYAITSGL